MGVETRSAISQLEAALAGSGGGGGGSAELQKAIAEAKAARAETKSTQQSLTNANRRLDALERKARPAAGK